MRRGAVLSFVVCAIALASLPLACQDATQVKVLLSTNACGAAAGGSAKTSLYVGARGAARSPAPQTEVLGCPGPELGSITLVPGDKDGDVLFEAVMSTDGSDCDKSPAKCIVARRLVGYAKHRGLVLPVSLDTKCIGVTCDPASTCYDGSCRPADVVCSGSSCDVAPLDGGTPSDAASDSPASPLDGSADAPLDATPLDGGACPRPTQAATHIAAGGSRLYYSTSSNEVIALASDGTENGVIAASPLAVDFLAAGNGAAAAATSKRIHLSGGGAVDLVEPILGLAVLDTPGPSIGYLHPSGYNANFLTGELGTFDLVAAGGNHLYVTRGTDIVDATTKTTFAQTGKVDHLAATNDRIVWTQGTSLLFGTVAPQVRNTLATLPDVAEAVAAQGNRVAIALDSPGPVSRKLDEIRVYDTDAKGASTILGVVSALAVGLKPIQLAVVGPCVYVLHGGAVTVYRAP